ncbi:dirigent protein 2 [Cryptomeria japonica]|uniref:dirigent protein 2 n=1 Tax=Cryptomeria japonica TaxID=3369 RepID=UPI0027D9D915|nr:dirigent protein 2 [Cryptomeria japonica]
MNRVAELCVIFTIILCGKGANGADKTMVFYMHDVLTGNSQTAKPVVVPSGSGSNLEFGAMTVIDDVLTETADPSSKVVGRGQGMYVTSSLDVSNFLLVFTAVLTSSEYAKSTINFQGADRFVQSKRDVSVVGGTGMFKFAQGYATIESAGLASANVVLKFTVVLRYDSNSSTPATSTGSGDNTLPFSSGKMCSPSRLSIYSLIFLLQLLLCLDFGQLGFF